MTCNSVRERLDEYVDLEMGPSARLSVRIHLLGCGDCRAALRETRALTRQLAGLPGAPGVLPARGRAVRNLRLAVGLAIVVVLLLPAALPMAKKMRAASYGPATSVPGPVVTTPEGRGIRTVHYTTTTHRTADAGFYGPDMADSRAEMSIKYPDKWKSEGIVVNGSEPKLLTRSGDRLLTQGNDMGRGGSHYQCALMRTGAPLISPDAFTRTGIETGLLVADAFPNAGPYDPSSPVVEHHTEWGPQGEMIIVVKLRRTSYRDVGEGVLRATLDASTGLVSSWDLEVMTTDTGEPSSPGAKAPAQTWHYGYHTICERVEYNIELPDSLFDTDPPFGPTVMDAYSPEGLKEEYESEVRAFQEAYAKSGDPETWAKAATYWGSKESRRFEFLYLIPPKDQAEIRGKLREIGINLSE